MGRAREQLAPDFTLHAPPEQQEAENWANYRGWGGVKGGSDVISRAGIQPGHGGLKRGEERGRVCVDTAFLVSVDSSSCPLSPNLEFPIHPRAATLSCLNGKEAALT